MAECGRKSNRHAAPIASQDVSSKSCELYKMAVRSVRVAATLYFPTTRPFGVHARSVSPLDFRLECRNMRRLINEEIKFLTHTSPRLIPALERMSAPREGLHNPARRCRQRPRFVSSVKTPSDQFNESIYAQTGV